MSDAPPSYATATGSSTTSNTQPNRLQVPGARNGIPADRRRSMEDEHRPLPEGWVRQFDTNEQHQFFVNTKATPPTSIWHHPYDDEKYLSTLTSDQREQIQEDERQRQLHDYTSDDESARKPSKSTASGIPSQSTGSSSFSQELPPRPSKNDPNTKKSFGDKLKEKVTGQTKEERAASKARQEEEERQYYEAHQRYRQCLQKAQMTGQPQYFATDKNGKQVFVEPPSQGYGYGAGGPYGGYGSGYGIGPYSSGMYGNPNAGYGRPGYGYGRPYGGGYGGGLGLPIAGGLLGGALLGGLLF